MTAPARLRPDIALLLAAQRALDLPGAYVPPKGLLPLDRALEGALDCLVVGDDGLRAPAAVADQGERVERLFLALILAAERWSGGDARRAQELAPALAATVKAYAEALALQRQASPPHKAPAHDIRHPGGRAPGASFAALSDPERAAPEREAADSSAPQEAAHA